MRVIEARNAHSALPMGLALLAAEGIPMPSRAGSTITHPLPVTTIYRRPDERVVFWPERDANPFFHFFEGLFYLAGRRDLDFMTQFLPRMRDFSDDGVNLQGSYGWRWRHHFGYDQLERLIALLQKNLMSRRAILTMWDPRCDLLEDEGASSDVPCNTTIKFRVVYGGRDEPNRLSIVVFNRSNDIIYGLYGANAVHFSMLQEYVAARLGLVVGTMTTISTDFHAYEDIYEKVYRGSLRESDAASRDGPYESGEVVPLPMVSHPGSWDEELHRFLSNPNEGVFLYQNLFFPRVARPLWNSHVAWKTGDLDAALVLAVRCVSPDWKKAAVEWLLRRKKR